ncbi:MAG: antitoxin Xre/MbcA/ParS toxin-binding domain-containing protein [Pseudomonadota bacterium]
MVQTEKSIVAMTTGVPFSDTSALIDRIQKGLPYSSFERLGKHYEVSRKGLLSMIGISASTAGRRQTKQKMSIHEGEKIVRYARLLDLTLGLMDGNKESALRWLASPARALGGKTPISYASIELGAQQVENLIGRIEHGVIS